MKIRPLGDRLVVKRHQPEAMSTGGIWFPDKAQGKERARTGTVRAVGPGRRLESGEYVPVGVGVGDVVSYIEYHTGAEVRIDGEDYVVMSSVDLLGVVEP